MLRAVEFEGHGAREDQEDLLGIVMDICITGGPARRELCHVDLEIA
jgi:hypothetical protein